MGDSERDGGWRGRLAEMEEQLHALAAELASDAGEPAPEPPPPDPPPVAAPPPPPSPPRAAPPPPPRAPTRPAGPAPAAVAPANPTLEAMCARLLASMRELMAGYELALTHVATRPDAGAVTVAAGPFDGMATLERFEAALRELPQVSDVAVRGYEGADRAVLEVRLA